MTCITAFSQKGFLEIPLSAPLKTILRKRVLIPIPKMLVNKDDEQKYCMSRRQIDSAAFIFVCCSAFGEFVHQRHI